MKTLRFLLFWMLPCNVEPLFPTDKLAGFILDLIWGSSASLPEVLTQNPLINMTTGEIIRHFGYPYEKHEVVTDDGYILELHRIPPNNKTSTKSAKKEPVLFLPGIFIHSGFFVAKGENSPGIVFSDAGYDVWLHNHRGTRYSRKHKSLDPNTQRQFWNYSFHEMGVHDLPATVDHILLTTNKSQIYLIGHSMGGAVATIFLAALPAYNEKVKEVFLWAPAIYLPRAYYSVARMGIQHVVDRMLFIFDEMEMFPNTNNVILLISRLCGSPSASRLCALPVFAATFSLPSLRTSLDETKKGGLVFLIAQTIGGASVKTLRHFIQMITNGDFSQYDYGPKGNSIAYNQTTAPHYNYQNVKSPVSIYYAEYDNIINSLDLLEVGRNFTNFKGFVRIPELTFNHIDFGISDNAKQYIYNPVINEMSLNEEQTIIIAQTLTVLNQHFNLYYVIIFMIFVLVVILLFITMVRHQLSKRENLILHRYVD